MSSSEEQTFPFLKNGIAQISILVPDLDKAVEMYWRKFGIGPWMIYTYGKPLVKEMTYYGQPSEHKMRIALANIGQMRIELIQPLEGENIYADFIKEHGYGFHHLGLLVENMSNAIDKVESIGYQIIQEGCGFGLDGDGHYAYINTEKDLGVTLELIQRPKSRVKPDKIYPESE